jgi:hypothetical protein
MRPCVRPSMRPSHAPPAMMPFARIRSRLATEARYLLERCCLVHVIGKIRHDERDGWQPRKVAREIRYALLDRKPFGERFPRLCFLGLPLSTKPTKPRPFGPEDGCERRTGFAIRTIVGHAECRAGVKGEIVRLARVRYSMVVSEQGSGSRQQINVRRLRIADDLVVRVVFLDHHDDMIVCRDEIVGRHQSSPARKDSPSLI